MWPRARIGSLAVLVLLAACTQNGQQRPGDGATAAGPGGSVTVFAAASLAESFKDAQPAFRDAHRGASIIFNFSASSALATQIIEQGGADVFASADEPSMQRVADKGLLDRPAGRLVRNRLEIVVGQGNPRGIKQLADLRRADVKVVLAAPQVPAGRYSREALSKAGVRVRPVSLENDVKAVVSKVALGEADAGIAYHTDVLAAAETVDGVAIPEAQNVLATYLIAALKEARNPALARAFVRFVIAGEGQQIMIRHGFLVP